VVVLTIALCVYLFIPHKQSIHYNNLPNDSIILYTNTNEVLEKISKKINPNTATFKELCEAGFTKKQATNCINYIQAGNTFSYIEDIRKLYTIQDSDFKRISKNLYIPPHKYIVEQKQINTPNTIIQKKTKLQVNLNTSDSLELQKLPGIGTFRAKKIIEMRTKLGGFYTIHQLQSIYSFDSILIEKIRPFCYIDSSQIQKINLNSTTFKDLVAHPYVSYYIAKNILDYKKIVGTIESIEELRTNAIIKPKDYEILKYYIKTF
jgi:DNA uptake protein ComE-like DNA-binding protein